MKDRTGSGAILAGFTDTDDVNVGIQAGMPIKPVFPDKEGIGTLLIPNSVALIQNSPHPVEAKTGSLRPEQFGLQLMPKGSGSKTTGQSG